MSSKLARSVGRTKTRETVRLGRHLEKNLVAYATAAGAGLLAAALPADAQIIYTPSNIPIMTAQLNKGPTHTPLDLNNDGNPDFGFAMSSTKGYSYSGTTSRFKFFLKVTPGQKGNEAAHGTRLTSAAAIAAGKAIGPELKFGAGDLYMALSSFKTAVRSSGTWRFVEYAYVGLKFMINGQVHYGWARVKFPYPGGTLYPSIYGYAYESTPNQPIIAGQTSGSAAERISVNAPATLGMLAAGTSGVNVWREKPTGTPR